MEKMGRYDVYFSPLYDPEEAAFISGRKCKIPTKVFIKYFAPKGRGWRLGSNSTLLGDPYFVEDGKIYCPNDNFVLWLSPQRIVYYDEYCHKFSLLNGTEAIENPDKEEYQVKNSELPGFVSECKDCIKFLKENYPEYTKSTRGTILEKFERLLELWDMANGSLHLNEELVDLDQFWVSDQLLREILRSDRVIFDRPVVYGSYHRNKSLFDTSKVLILWGRNFIENDDPNKRFQKRWSLPKVYLNDVLDPEKLEESMDQEEYLDDVYFACEPNWFVRLNNGDEVCLQEVFGLIFVKMKDLFEGNFSYKKRRELPPCIGGYLWSEEVIYNDRPKIERYDHWFVDPEKRPDNKVFDFEETLKNPEFFEGVIEEMSKFPKELYDFSESIALIQAALGVIKALPDGLEKALEAAVQIPLPEEECNLFDTNRAKAWIFLEEYFGSKVWYDYFTDTEHNGAEKTRLEGFYYPELDFRHQEMPEVIDLPSPGFRRFVRMNGEIRYKWRDMSTHLYPEPDPHPSDWMLN